MAVGERVFIPGSAASYVVEPGEDEGFVRLAFEWTEGVPETTHSRIIDLDERLIPGLVTALLAASGHQPALC